MSYLTRWDPFQELHSMRSAFDRLWDGVNANREGEDIATASLALDVYETGDALVVRAPIPGVDPDDLQINIEDDVLTISGESRFEDESGEGRYIRRELRWGTFKRSLRLPPTVDAEKADATFENGMLHLTLPRREEAKPRQIKVTPKQVISG